ncbi:unnamed protein product [Victoria cruziana]
MQRRRQKRVSTHGVSCMGAMLEAVRAHSLSVIPGCFAQEKLGACVSLCGVFASAYCDVCRVASWPFFIRCRLHERWREEVTEESEHTWGFSCMDRCACLRLCVLASLSVTPIFSLWEGNREREEMGNRHLGFMCSC